MKPVTDLHAKMAGVFEIDPGIVHNFSDGLYAKQMTIPKGFVAGQHAHTFSHLSVLAKGKVLVKTDTGERVYDAPACIEIKKQTNHMITALEDAVWFCIHATDETDVDRIDEVLIEKGE